MSTPDSTPLVASAAALALVLASIAGSGCARSVSAKERVSARIHYDLGTTALQSGLLNDATREFLQAVRLNPYFPEVHNALGYAYHQRGISDRSEEHYRKAIELDPAFSEAYNNFGALLLDLGRFDEAAQCFETVLKDITYPSPQFAEGHLGYAAFKLGRTQDAIRHLKNAIATDPRFCRGYIWLADVYRAQKIADQEVAALSRFMAMCVDDNEVRAHVHQSFVDQARYDLGMAFLARHDLSLARAQFEACVNEADSLSTTSRLCREGLAAAQEN